MDIGDWLRGLGLAQYEAAFRDNEIDETVLPHLTADDLKELGVASIGHRRKLLAAIAAPSSSAPSAPAAAAILSREAGEGDRPVARRETGVLTDALWGGGGGEGEFARRSSDPRVATRGGEDFAERRPITVMFCDLVGSTALAARLDAEDWRNLVNSYLDEASSAVTGLGGHVLKKLGDGLMALFGYPQAQENDAERAVRAALAIQRALAEINARNARKGAPELAARIGLESGPVVVDATGEVFGDAPNVAARVQAAAEPGSVLVTINVQRQVAGLFVAEERGPHELKGVPAPVNLFRITRASGAGRRGAARALTPFVGREEELSLLMRRWERTRGGEGQLVLVVGEPGLGKSRLIEEFRARIAGTPHTWVDWSASQLLQNTPLHPLAEWGRQRFGGTDAPAEQRLADLESSLRQVKIDADEAAPLLAPLLDIPLPPAREARLSPEEMRRKQLAAIVSWILAGARAQPVVLAFEDLQWADPTSVDILRALAERGAQAPLFLVATSRPEFRPPWDLRSHHGVISLSPLEQAQVLRMVGEIASRHALSKDVIEGVSERTGGVPLFIEEVTRLLLERGDEGGAQAIPLTLQQSLAARLDRLGEARETAQIGAVLGREFSYLLLRAVAGSDDRVSPPPPGHSPSKDGRPSTPYAAVPLPRSAREDAPNGAASILPRSAGEGDHAKHGGGGYSEASLQPVLDRLAEADILFVDGVPPQATYRFKHALIQDAAYDSLLKSRRQALHRRAAEALRDDPDRAAAEPEVIAHHFTQGGLDDLAIEWWGKAGDQALRRSAFQEAIAHLGKAIAMADKEGATAPTASTQRGKLKTDYGHAVMWSKGFAAAETRSALGVAEERNEKALDAGERLKVYIARFLRSFAGGELLGARASAEDFVRQAEVERDTAAAAVARRQLGMACLLCGEPTEARRQLEMALSESAQQEDAEYDPSAYFLDTQTAALGWLSIVTWVLGEAGQARTLIKQTVARGEKLGHTTTIVNALWCQTILETCRDDPAAALPAAEAMASPARAHNMAVYIALAEIIANWAAGRRADPAPAAKALRVALTRYMDDGNRITTPWIHGLLAELQFASSDPIGALSAIDAGLGIARDTAEHLFDSYLYRLRGDILSKSEQPDLSAAEEAYRTALTTAVDQRARSFSLRAALSLAKLYQSTGRPVEAHAVLAPALSLLPSGRRVGDEGTPASHEAADAVTPDPSPERERGDAFTEMPELREAEELLAALAETEEVKSAVDQHSRRLHLQTAYAQAVVWSKGWAADETRAAFERTGDLAARSDRPTDRFPALYGQALWNLVRGDITAGQGVAERFLREAEADGGAGEVGVARRVLGLACIFRGELAGARSNLERAMGSYVKARDNEIREKFAQDTGVVSRSFLAFASWLLGDHQRAHQLIEEATRLANDLGHIPSAINTLSFKSHIGCLQNDVRSVSVDAENLLKTSQQHGLELFVTLADVLLSWARGRLGNGRVGAEELRQSLARYASQGNRCFTPMFQGCLAELELDAGEAERALTAIEDGLANAQDGGQHFADSLLHRLRGDILLKRDAANPGPAEEAYRTAIAIAHQQGARSFELRAALSLAKLYQSTGRRVEAHAVLAPALEGWPSPLSLSGEGSGVRAPADSPDAAGPSSPALLPEGEGGVAEMPELREAVALLAALTETDEVKASTAQQKRRFELQTAYGQALLWSKGFAAEETKAAFDRARELAGPSADAARLFSVRYEEFTRGFIGGDLRSARAIAEDFLHDAEAGGFAMEAVVGRRILGSVCLCQGDLRQARTHLERALVDYSPDRDAEARLRFGMDTRIVALTYLALASWHLGEVGRSRLLIEEAVRLAAGSGHATTLAFAYIYQAAIEARRGDAAAALAVAERLEDLCREHGLEYFLKASQSRSAWARAHSLGSRASSAELTEELADQKRRDNWLGLPLNFGQLGEIEAATGNLDGALAQIGEGLAIAEKTGERYTDSFLHRLRGDVLVKRNPDDPAPAEDAYGTAVAIAKDQGARSYELIGSLALARLYQSSGRPLEARAILAPALEGFPSLLPLGEGGGRSPPDEGSDTLTPGPSPARESGEAAYAEMPELREAVELLAALA